MIIWRILAFGLLVGCSHASWTSMDSWYRPAPPAESAWVPLADSSFNLVTSANRSKAAAMLERDSAIPIDGELAAALIGQQAPLADAWLVRGLCLACEGGLLLVYKSEDQDALLVFHGSLSKRALPMTRSPVVVVGLEDVPDVYVDVSSNE